MMLVSTDMQTHLADDFHGQNALDMGRIAIHFLPK